MTWALVTIGLTLFVGRFFCGFACPLGTHQPVHRLAVSARSWALAGRVEANRHRRSQALKYYLLVGLLALALMGSVQTGVFDPLPLIHRSVNLALAPLADNRLGLLSDEPRAYASVWLIGVVFLGGGGPEPGLAPVLLPLRLSPGGAFRPAEPFRPLAHRQDFGQMRRLPAL